MFGSLEFRTNATAGMGEWRAYLRRAAKERSLYAACDQGDASCPSYLRQWRGKLSAWKSHGLLVQLDEVNAYVNGAIHYTEDSAAFGHRDYWATPAESLKGRGDCEDYAIAKYESLRRLGLPESSLRIVIVNDTRRKLGHAVLTVSTSDGLFVLDNLKARPYLHSRIASYAPVYSLNRQGRWINVAAKEVGPAVVAALEGKASSASLAGMLRPSLADEDAALTLRPALPPPAVGDELAAEPPGGTGE